MKSTRGARTIRWSRRCWTPRAGRWQPFESDFAHTHRLRRDTLKKLSRHTRKDNIQFDGLARVSHVTDATDWRVEYPFVVLNPDSEAEIAPLVKGCIELGLTIIPRGGGTGYTGGAIPLDPDSAVINTEKLEALSAVEMTRLPGVDHDYATIHCGAGRGHAARDGSGGRAGFRVRGRPHFGRCLVHRRQRGDERRRQEGRAVGHRAGQSGVVAHGHAGCGMAGSHAPRPQPGQDSRYRNGAFRRSGATTSAARAEIARPEILEIPGPHFRKVGLGKDVTDKFLAGLPGIQKEGCDGIITSARFILHKLPQYTRTVCLEFFGQVRDAVPAIVEVKNYLDAHPQAILAGLEHLDARYIKAVGYATKANRNERPKMILLADVVSDDESRLRRSCLAHRAAGQCPRR